MIRVSKLIVTQKNSLGQPLDNNFPTYAQLSTLKTEELREGILVGQNSLIEVVGLTDSRSPIIKKLTLRQEGEIIRTLRRDEFLLTQYQTLPETLYLVAETRRRSGDEMPVPMLSFWWKAPLLFWELTDRVSYRITKAEDFCTWQPRPQAFRLFLSRVVYRIKPRELISPKQWGAWREKFFLSHGLRGERLQALDHATATLFLEEGGVK